MSQEIGIQYAKPGIDEEGYFIQCPVCPTITRANPNWTSEDSVTKGTARLHAEHWEEEHTPICKWFWGCHEKATGVTPHSTLGEVDTCDEHHEFSKGGGPAGVPPLAAARLRAMTPEQRKLVIGR